MADPIGVTFVPTDEQSLMGRKNLAAQGGIPEAVKFISLQIPRFAGAAAIAPDALLQAQGQMSPASSVVDSILQSLGHGPEPQQPGNLSDLLRGAVNGDQRRRPNHGSPMLGQPSVPNLGAAPPPRVIPGIDTMGTPPPSGQPTREWDAPISGPLVGQATGELETAAARASRGYNPPLIDKYDWNTSNSRTLF